MFDIEQYFPMYSASLIDTIARIREKADAFLVAELNRRGVTGLVPSHGAILAQLYRFGPLPMGRLARLIRRKKNTVTTLVRKLEAGGYVTCDKAQTDSRVTLVAPTPKTTAFRPDFEAISQALLHRAWGDTPDADRQDLMDRLLELEARLDCFC